ncbi:MAG TPA: ABC transporter ATP-binding protein [Pirellulales bacterium]|jgi:putative ABC transport system ATP-binding protein
MNNPSTNGDFLRTSGLTKDYPDGKVTALTDVNLVIPRGQYAAIVGPSGCGKSTLLNLLGALDRPTSGDVYFEGRSFAAIGDLDQFRALKLGFVFQSFYLLPILTARENVQIPMFEGSLGAADRAARAGELLELVGMSHRAHHLPKQLSVGERQRVAIARALANAPELLLADEPTGNLDSKAAQGICDMFEHLHRERGMTLVLVTHDQNVADRAERIIRMRDGRVLEA